MECFKPDENIDNAFFSGTFFGDPIALAACDATLTKCAKEDVAINNIAKGAWLRAHLPTAHRDFFEVTATHLSRLKFKTPRHGAAFHHHCAVAGVLIYKYFGVMFAHRDTDLQRAANAFEYAIVKMRAGDTDYEPPNMKVMRR